MPNFSRLETFIQEKMVDVRTFYMLAAGQRLPVEFRVEDGRIELICERYLLRRVGTRL